MWWSSPGAYWKTFKTFKNSNFTSWTTIRIHSQCCWFCNKQINIIFKRLFSSFRMYRGFHSINRRFHPDLLEKSIKSKFLPMTVQQPPIRKSRNVNSWWPELVYKLGLLSWTNSQALFYRSNFHFLNSDEFEIFIRTVFDPSNKTLTDIGAGEFTQNYYRLLFKVLSKSHYKVSCVFPMVWIPYEAV